MKTVILAGGFGTRLSEETAVKPKPMVEIGGRPILWHIMKSYSAYGINEFIICCGYKGYMIKEYFSNYFLHMSDVTFDISKNNVEIHNKKSEPWKVTLLDTGEDSLTGNRLFHTKDYLDKNEPFCLTYGDGLSNVNFKKLIDFHKSHGKDATLTAVRPPGRYGALKIEGENNVINFQEKAEGKNSWINGGFFVLQPSVLDRIKGDNVSWEHEPLSTLANEQQLKSFKHEGFWQPMDTLREKKHLCELWNSGEAPWKIWS
jgi:glucose-1-phosphate cytidylyltransferase